jgi:hypothetical protein
MGEIFHIIPFDQEANALDPVFRADDSRLAKEIDGEGGIVRWCSRRGVTLPRGACSHFPTSREVATMLRGLYLRGARPALRHHILPVQLAV